MAFRRGERIVGTMLLGERPARPEQLDQIERAIAAHPAQQVQPERGSLTKADELPPEPRGEMTEDFMVQQDIEDPRTPLTDEIEKDASCKSCRDGDHRACPGGRVNPPCACWAGGGLEPNRMAKANPTTCPACFDGEHEDCGPVRGSDCACSCLDTRSQPGTADRGGEGTGDLLLAPGTPGPSLAPAVTFGRVEQAADADPTRQASMASDEWLFGGRRSPRPGPASSIEARMHDDWLRARGLEPRRQLQADGVER